MDHHFFLIFFLSKQLSMVETNFILELYVQLIIKSILIKYVNQSVS